LSAAFAVFPAEYADGYNLPGQADDVVFCRDVRGSAFEPFDPCARRRVHDRAAALLEHQRDLVFHAQEYAAEIDSDDAIPFLCFLCQHCPPARAAYLLTSSHRSGLRGAAAELLEQTRGVLTVQPTLSVWPRRVA